MLELTMDSRGARILILALFGMALASPLVAACACLASAPDPSPPADCHSTPTQTLTVGCCCIESAGDEADGERATLPAPRVATAHATPVAELHAAFLVAPESTIAPVEVAPPPLAAPLRL